MADFVYKIMRNGTNDGMTDLKKRAQLVQSKVDGLITVFPTSATHTTHMDGETVFFVTGTTGSLGSYILAHLLRLNSVKRVYAFNRPSTVDILVRHQTIFDKSALDPALLSSPKLVLLEGLLTTDRFGVSDDMFTEVGTLLINSPPLRWLTYVTSSFNRFIAR